MVGRWMAPLPRLQLLISFNFFCGAKVSFHVEQEFGHYRAEASMMSREDAIELAELLRAANSDYLRKFGIEIESELMVIANA